MGLHLISWRSVFLAAAYFVAVMVLPLLIGAFNYYNKAAIPGQPMEAPAFTGPLPAPPTPDLSKKIAVVVSGAYGAEITDTLPPFEILARSNRFNVYAIAPERTVIPLAPGPVAGGSSLDFVPQLSFAEYDATIGAPPDLIVVPNLPGYTPERDAAVLEWIRGHVGPRTTLLGICDGTMVVADTGLVDGHAATTNPADFGYVEAHAPSATWLRNLRYVDDGAVVTSSAVSSGIDATLHVVDRFAGRATALDVARQLGYTHTNALDDPRFDPPGNLRPAMALLTGFEVRQQLGVLLYDGVSEFGLAGLLDPELGSTSSNAFVMAPERRIMRGANGFLFVPRFTFNSVPALHRVLIPLGENNAARQQVVAAWSADQGRPAVEDIYQQVGPGESVYDATLQDLARTRYGALAQTVASSLFYPVDPAQFAGAAWPVREILAVAALMLLGAGTVFGATHLRLPRRARLRAQPQPA
jgi:transcriptional regulator GlxA family with amidase domain